MALGHSSSAFVHTTTPALPLSHKPVGPFNIHPRPVGVTASSPYMWHGIARFCLRGPECLHETAW